MALPTVYSDAIETQVSSTATPAPANLSRSKKSTAPFIWTAASEVSGTVIGLVKIPKGARLLSGWMIADASFGSTQLSVGLSATDATANIDDAVEAGYKPDGTAVTVGTAVADSATCLKAAATITTTKLEFLVTTALGFLYETKKEVWLTLTTSAATAGTAVVRGYIDYAVD